MLNVVAIQGRLTHDPELKTTPNGVSVCSFRIACERSLQTRQYQDQQGSNRTVVEIVANNVSFCGGKAAEKPATASYEKQTENHVREANAARSAPQQPQSYAQGSVDDFAEIYDADEIPF